LITGIVRITCWANPATDLVQTLNGPLDATVIPLDASITRAAGRLDVEVEIPAEWRWPRFITADGIIASDPVPQSVMLTRISHIGLVSREKWG
jgi:hypothetical protein